MAEMNPRRLLWTKTADVSCLCRHGLLSLLFVGLLQIDSFMFWGETGADLVDLIYDSWLSLKDSWKWPKPNLKCLLTVSFPDKRFFWWVCSLKINTCDPPAKNSEFWDWDYPRIYWIYVKKSNFNKHGLCLFKKTKQHNQNEPPQNLIIAPLEWTQTQRRFSHLATYPAILEFLLFIFILLPRRNVPSGPSADRQEPDTYRAAAVTQNGSRQT